MSPDPLRPKKTLVIPKNIKLHCFPALILSCGHTLTCCITAILTVNVQGLFLSTPDMSSIIIIDQFYITKTESTVIMAEKKQYSIKLKKDGKYYVGYCLEIPQARGQGNTKNDAIEDTKRAIKLCRSYLSKKKAGSGVITISV